ncbi:unnamed protein product [Cuscuta campestris]|uniref:Uncharacterized protein n=1 Tax=Cuscuta campestris TaxID=132261 RepID=A0A484LK48_9ASTE|nr:unnamed protein product [Cuscuta campestris]
MGLQVLVLLRVDGTWDTHGIFTTKYNIVIEVPNDTMLSSLLDILKCAICIDWSQNGVRLSCIVESYPHLLSLPIMRKYITI